MVTKEARKDFDAVWVKRNLGTRKVLAEAVKLAGKDDLGRKIPAYYVMHEALTEYVERRRKTAKK